MLIDKLVTYSCPDAVYFRQADKEDAIFAAAYYELNSETQKHSGAIGFYDTKNDKLEEISFRDWRAIFDFYWAAPDRIVTATVDGTVELMSISEDMSEIGLLSSVKLSHKPLFLAHCQNNIYASCEAGYIAQIDSNQMKVIKEFRGHSDNVWCIDLLPKTGIFGTGSDDTFVKFYNDQTMQATSSFKPFKELSGSSVTSIKFEPFGMDFTVAIGTFENKIAFFDIRLINKKLFELDIKGAAWRQNYVGNELFVALGSANGYQKFVKTEGTEIKEICHFTAPHDSLVYGIDVRQDCGQERVVSCSFYDRQIVLSNPNKPKPEQ